MANKYNLHLEHKLNNKFEVVYNSILDLKKFGELHPYMAEVKIHSNAAPDHIEYEINEKLNLFGIVQLKPNYKAKVIEVVQNRHIQYLSQVKKNIFLTIDFTVTNNKEQEITTVKETIEVRGSKFISMVFLNILKKSHLKVFENLKTI